MLAAVESGNVDAGFVYKTDAAISKKVKVAFEVPAGDAPKISYPLALLKDAPQPDAAKNFIAYSEFGRRDGGVSNSLVSSCCHHRPAK